MSEQNKERPSLSCYGNGSVTIKNLSASEIEKIQGVLGGMWHMILEDDKKELTFTPRYKELSEVTDEEMLPFWRPYDAKGQSHQKMFDDIDGSGEKLFLSPEIHIRYLCGYNYSNESYKEYVELLESYGFTQFRSKRGDDGSYQEVFILSAFVFAKGDLKELIQDVKENKEKLNLALRFLARNVSFGTLDVCVQRMAAVID